MKRIRVGGICILDSKILLIHRINLEKPIGEQDYYVIPGGGVEEGESLEDAAAREVDEETSVKVTVKEVFAERKLPEEDKEETYYICEYVSGEPKLKESTDEFEEMQLGVHFYKPMWVELSEIKNITLYPEEIKSLILEKLE